MVRACLVCAGRRLLPGNALALAAALALLAAPAPAAGSAPQDGDHAASRRAIHDFLGGLVGGRWVAVGEWTNGQPFRQEQVYEWALGDRIVEVTTIGVVDEDGAIGERSKGIRAWDESRGEARFWEFDRFGSLIDGRCFLGGETLVYEYEYSVEGEMRTLRDSWRRLDLDEYEMSVAQQGDDGAFEVLLRTNYTRTRD